MRVVDVTQWYAPRSGGIRTYLHAKAAYAAEHGLSHALVVPGSSSGAQRLHGSPLVALSGVPTGQEAGYRLIPHPGPIVRVLERLDPAILVLHDATAFPRSLLRWAHRRAVPVAFVVHSELQAAATGAPGPVRLPTQHLLRIVQERGLEGPDAVITTSRAAASRLRRRDGTPTFVSALGVDTDVFHPREPDPTVRRSLVHPDETLVIHAGRLSAEKHPLLLIDALVGTPDGVVLAIAGEGPSSEDLRERARAAGVDRRVRWLGHIGDPNELARLFATADCYLHVNPAEPFGLAPLEALACGCRVVLPDDAGVADVIRDGEAVLVSPNSAAALADGIERALRGPRPQPDLARISWRRSFDREWALYRSLASRGAQGCVAA